MPLYDYQCRQCKTVFEVRATFQEKEAGLEPQCPRCHGKKTHQLLTTGLFVRQKYGGQSTGSTACGPSCGGDCGSCGS